MKSKNVTRLAQSFLRVFCAGLMVPAGASSLTLALAGELSSIKTETASGLYTTKFSTPKGSIQVHLPDDIAAGDTISGTVIAEPMGKTQKEKQQNLDELNGYVVELDNADTSVAKKVLQWGIPAALSGGTALLLLKNKDGDVVGQTAVPVKAQLANPGRPSIPTSRPFDVPNFGQAGKPIEITGPFDGSFENTSLRMGSQEVRKLAESPRKLIAESPKDVVGAAALKVKEGSVEATEEYRNVSQKLSSGTHTLRPGQQTWLKTTVSGLKGLEDPIQVQLVNKTPDVVQLKGGNEQTFVIKPQDVKGDSYTLPCTMIGVEPGRYSISASVTPSIDALDSWHRQKKAIETSEDFNKWIAGVKEYLSKYAAAQGNDAIGQAAAQTAKDVAENLPESKNKDDLEEKKMLADLQLRRVAAPKAAAAVFISGFEAYKAAIKAIVTGGAVIDWDVVKKGLDFLKTMGQELDDDELKKKAEQAKKLIEEAQKAKKAKKDAEELFEKAKEAVKQANELYNKYSEQ